MKDQQASYPQLRFKGFTDPWEERKLSEIVDIYDGTHQTPIYTDSGVKFVSVENISNLETKKYISQEAYNKEYAKKQAQKGDVLMTRIGDIGTSRVIETEEPLAYYVTLSLLKPKKIESNFLSWLISSPEVQRNIWKRTLHIAFPKKINLGEINQVEVMIPKNKEQQKIGSFFKQLDDTIALHQRKLAKLKELKQGYLQKLFPRNGSKFPQLRFAGFADAWEQRKLEKVFDFSISTNSLSRAHLNYDGGGIKTVHYGDILVKYGPILDISRDRIPFITDGALGKYRNSLLENGDIIFTDAAEDETVGKAVEVSGIKDDYVVSGLHTIVARPKEKMAVFFMGYYINSDTYHRQLLPLMQGTKISSISKSNLQKTTVSHPKSTNEQSKIGAFFKQLDDTITLHQRKLEKLQELKKGYLQKMFC
ncbi:restriction endonuclease subunit S [Liquorilactobacillus uvarum]|uniref:Type I restriction modification DNA specificity domain-containing protein n=1 Tax=Liquorilactobacillus uvarum DSM 19971 TaxID=1423812 RepID=A0A0R1PUD0_9LACO|nr:restriction endonuclease subunit S [Liquorilactobacillus uvarum]KRL33333.1 hypothetical protein FD20_GL001999 [Liquorilactobacillus uvarum DSM 19971]